MATRVFDIAKQLGVKSKAIVEKCHDEGISTTVIKNHMSTVSAGLEATIRDWFGGASGTAVETTTKIDLEKVRAAPKRRAKPLKSPEPALEAVPVTSTPTPVIEIPGTEPSRAVAIAASPSGAAVAVAPATDGVAPSPTAPSPGDETIAVSDEAATAAPPTTTGTEPVEVEAQAASATDNNAPPAETPTSTRPVVKTSQATMNVPSRPKVIAPAGPQLKEKTKVKLSGPKIIRVEAPEKLEPPRPRRVGGGGAPMPGGRGVGGGMGGGPPMFGGDRGRSPRRGQNKRRSDASPGLAGQGGAGVSSPRRRGRAAVTNRDWIGPGAFSEKDLAEREARLQRSGGYLKQHRQRLRQQKTERAVTAAQGGGKVTIAEPFSIKDLSAATGIKAANIVKKLFMQGVMATINSGIDAEKAQEIMIEYDIELEVVEAKSAEAVVAESFEERVRIDERSRGPVVTILGHVDHGKTSLLDRIRKANVAEGEAGGITQATSAFRVPVHVGDTDKQIVFIDTPGHEAFTAMRARGADITDIVVLVVAADDGVMPQTIESINHAKAAGVPIVVALNKIDKAEATDANIQRIMGQLAEHELNPTEWGGDTEVIRTSATKGEGIQDLLEVLDYQAQLLELKADFAGPARGSVIESCMAPGRGPVASVLVQEGELKVGAFIVAGRAFGRVRDITDDKGKRIKEVVPPTPVQISGLNEIPDAGDKFYIVDTLKKAQEAAEQRRIRERRTQLAQPKVTLDTLFSTMAQNAMKEITVVLKADVQGSIDVLKAEMEKVASDEVRTRVIHAAVGGITESDVVLADASRAIIVGFNVIPSSKARQLADQKGVEIRAYRVIYDVIDDITKAAEGLLTPELREEVLGHAEVRQVFKVSKVGTIAGCYVTDGVVQRDALIRVTRNDVVIEHDRRLEQLKRFKDDAKEVRANMECGMKIFAYDDIKEGDILECYKQIEVARKL